MTAAGIAATLSAMLALPRLLLWENRPFSVWYPEAMILLCGFVLWAFVFAWHTEYTHRPLFRFKIKLSLFAYATLAGVIVAIGLHWLIDPTLRALNPQDYPADFLHWIASALFSLAFTQLFLIYAPFAWVMRLFRNEQVALWVTVAFNLLVLVLKTNSSPMPLPLSLFLQLLILRIGLGYFAVWFYLRGGMLLVWWIGLLVEARHLLTFNGF